jgi:NADH dehydrogenase [ubiquinone] 1 alpha subcomplex assembly factor 7
VAGDGQKTGAAITPLAAELARRIAADGPITVADYMAAVLTDPRHGYYMGQDPLGARGDFVTAPEVSQMFGELVGLWCAETWQRLGAPSDLLLVELGPGRGTLMADALRAARVVPDFLAAISPHLVEVSPALRARQAEALAGAAPVWHDDLAALPEGPLLLLANEFFDALPVRQFVKRAGGWHERLVDLAEGAGPDAPRFAFVPGPRADDSVPGALRAAKEGSVFEVSPAALAVAAEIGRRLAAHGGAALVIDYGHAQRGVGETLQAVRRHARHEVLEAPGSADLTCHLDFAALAEAAAGAEVHGPVEQGVWLDRLGIAARAARLKEAATAAQARDIDEALVRLSDPAAMGRLFKALALVPPGFGPPAGFA